MEEVNKMIKTVGQLRDIIKNLEDDYKIELRVRRHLTDEELKNLAYPYPYETKNCILEFDDVGVSDKVLCLGCEPDKNNKKGE